MATHFPTEMSSTSSLPPTSPPSSSTPDQSPTRLLTFGSGGWVLLIAAVLTLLAAILVLKPVFETGFQRAVGDGQHPDTYGFDLSNLSIPKEQLMASGKPKDGVHAVPVSLVETMTVPEVRMANKNEFALFLTDSDKVIGVTIGNQSRAYPIRLLNVHEIVNDSLDHTPIAVTWSPLTGSAVVFRRPDAETQFGVSGLLYESNSLYFDRHSDPKKESLWSQLALHAISGPAVGQSLPVVPFTLATWKQWSTAHPETLVFRGLRTLKKQYTDAQDPFNMYLATDNLKFPVDPLPPAALRSLLLKTPITLTTTDMHHWKATLSTGMAPGTQTANERRVYAFLFAWYAQHPKDTDYSALVQGR